MNKFENKTSHPAFEDAARMLNCDLGQLPPNLFMMIRKTLLAYSTIQSHAPLRKEQIAVLVGLHCCGFKASDADPGIEEKKTVEHRQRAPSGPLM